MLQTENHIYMLLIYDLQLYYVKCMYTIKMQARKLLCTNTVLYWLLA